MKKESAFANSFLNLFRISAVMDRNETCLL